MSEYLTPAEVDRLVHLMSDHNRLFGVDTAIIADTFRAYAEIVEAVATMEDHRIMRWDGLHQACVFCGGIYYHGIPQHAPDCIHLRARKVRGYE